MKLLFENGTLTLNGCDTQNFGEGLLSGFKWDERTKNFRAPAYLYRKILDNFRKHHIKVIDQVAHRTGDHSLNTAVWAHADLFPYQAMACDTWKEAGKKGIVILPTGGGKTRVAIELIRREGVSALVIVPTRALLEQWHKSISEFYNCEIGMVGDGFDNVRMITICTFESAYRRMSYLGNRFEFLIVDEAHHFGCGIRDELLLMSAATKRLALTASLPVDERHRTRLERMMGPLIFERGINDLRGTYLSEFDHYKIPVLLTDQEQLEYSASYAFYQQYAQDTKWCWQELGWPAFARYACQSERGRKALASAKMARSIVSLSSKKLQILQRLLTEHWAQRVFIFVASTHDACEVARRFLAYPITAAVGRSEREMVLQKFREGAIRALVACKVLNEGIDVPEADVAIILGGTGNPREQVQRVGRVLRKKTNKRAIIYELIAEKTFEVRKSNQRNQHSGM